MTDHFTSATAQQLQNAYAIWAQKLPADQIVAICLGDPKHAMAAFFGISSAGRICGVASSDLLPNLDARFVALTEPLAPSNQPPTQQEITGFITFTSGSTGNPKPILRHPSSWIHSFGSTGVAANDKVAVLGHLSHSLPLYAASEAMHIGAQVIFCGTRPRGNPTVIYATPTLLKLAYENSPENPDVRLVFVGGGHLRETDRMLWAKKFPNAKICVFYGTAETSFVTMAETNTPLGSVGQAFDGVKISAPDGKIMVQTPMMALGYLDRQQRFDKDDTYATGELGWIDDQGFVFINGRTDRAVTISDKLVHLDQLEQELLALNGVEQAGVIALPDDKRGLRAYAAVSGATPKHPQISGITTLSDWPRLASGKTDYTALTALLSKAFL